MSDGNRAGDLVGLGAAGFDALRSAKTEGVGLGGDSEANVDAKSWTPRCDVDDLVLFDCYTNMGLGFFDGEFEFWCVG